MGICTGNRVGQQLVADALEAHLEIGPGLVHLVDETQARQAIFLALPPDGLALGLDPFAAVEYRHGRRPAPAATSPPPP